MKNEVIYKNSGEIEKQKNLHRKYVNWINEAIAKVKETGVELTEEMLPWVLSQTDAIIAETERQIRAEQGRISRFPFFSKKVDVTPVTDEVRDALDLLHRRLNGATENFNPSYVTFMDGAAALHPDIDRMLDEKWSIVLDTPEKAKVWELANKAADAINLLESYLEEHGDGLIHSCSNHAGVYSRCMVLLNGKFDNWTWKAEPWPHCIPHVTR